ncbi:MAG: hypothetical protein ACRYFU_05950 [Janthinobacterium lividum]
MKNVAVRHFALVLVAFATTSFVNQTFAQSTGTTLPIPKGPVTDDGVTGTDPVPPLPGPKPTAMFW